MHLQFFGLISSFLGINIIRSSADSVQINAVQFSVPIKILIVVLIAAAIGWGLATITDWLLRNQTELKVVAGHLVAIACASLVISSAEFMFGSQDGKATALMHILILIGTVISLVLARTRYRTSVVNAPNLPLTRSGFLLTFSGGLFFIYMVLVFVS